MPGAFPSCSAWFIGFFFFGTFLRTCSSEEEGIFEKKAEQTINGQKNKQKGIRGFCGAAPSPAVG